MRKRRVSLLWLLLTVAIAMSGCGSDENGEKSRGGDQMGIAAFDAAEQKAGEDTQTNGSEDTMSESGRKAEAEDVEEETAQSGMESGTTADGGTERGIDEKLIYHSTIRMETVDFDKTIKSFRDSIESMDGFVEYENYSNQLDSGYMSESIYRDYERFNSATEDRTYQATVRIPSSKYNQFLRDTEKIGNVTGKESNVTNVTTEYQDLQTKLDIYEAQQKRLVRQLEKASDKLVMQIERELTEIQVKIAQLHNRLKTIDTDVNYSTVEITIDEVSEYQEEPPSEDTFLDRLKNTVIASGKRFLYTAETLLLVFITLFPYLVVLLIIVALWLHFRKRKAGRDGAVTGSEKKEIPISTGGQETLQETDRDEESRSESEEKKQDE